MQGEGESGPRWDWRSRQGPEHVGSRRPQEGVWIFICNALRITEKLQAGEWHDWILLPARWMTEEGNNWALRFSRRGRSMIWLWKWMAKENGWSWRSSKLGGHRCWEIHPHGWWRPLWWYQEFGMKRGRGLDVKEQREVNEWKQYCDYMEGSHWNSDCGREGWMSPWLWLWPSRARIHQNFPITHWRKSINILALSCIIHLNSLISHFHPPLASLYHVRLPVHAFLPLHTLSFPSQMSVPPPTLAGTPIT